MFLKRFRYFAQIDATDCGPAALRMVAMHHGKHFSLENLRERSEKGKLGVNLLGISKAAESIGLRSLGARLSFEELCKANLPAIVHWNQNHFVVLYNVKGKGADRKIYIADPATGKVKLGVAEFCKSWFSTVSGGEGRGIALFLEPTPKFYEAEEDSTSKRGIPFLLSYLKPHKRLMTQLVAGLVAGSLIQLLFPFLTQSIVDIGIGTRDIGFIWLVLAAQLMLSLSAASVDFVRGWILLHLGTRINISLISDFLGKLMRLPVGFFDSRNTGDLLQRIGDHKRIQSFLTGSSLSVLFSMVNIVIFGAVLLYYNLLVFSVFIATSAFYVGWVLLFMKKRREIDNRTFTQNAANQSSIIQLIAGMQEIKLTSCENQKRWEWEHIQARLFKLNIKSLSLGQYQDAGATLINQIKNILITVLAANAVLNGELTLGMMLSVQYIIGQLNAPLAGIVGFIRSSQDAKISLERLAEVHDKEDEERPGNSLVHEIPACKPILLEDLSFRYEGAGSPLVLKKLNMTVSPKKITAIVGMSGSGKTTLVKLLLGFYKPTAGELRYGEMPFDSMSMSAWRGKCGVVMQDGYIFSDTIARNIAPGTEHIDMEKLYKAVETACIKDFIESLPLAYNTKIGQEGLGLSQGQKQRILIARAVYKDPEFIIFDEATNALDAKNEREIMKNLDQFFEGKTVVVVAHRLSTVKNADNIIVLDRGMIVEQGTHKELVANANVYYELVKNQLYV
ncbi:MAG: peptidase domain-containing ABC transporter [Bacteroidales bacterium]|nr:peptidase domain-containing ABC transporter [Bacteroidales bacterium]